MSRYGEPRWHQDCFGNCNGCASCINIHNIGEDTLTTPSKRFVTVGSVRYGLRLGAVSPPPPGAGPRYRSQCCWPSSGSGPVSRIPLLAASPINSHDIFSCVNRVRITEDDTLDQTARVTVREQVLHSTKTLLKSQLRRRSTVRPQVYARLCECGDGDRDRDRDRDRKDILTNLDRLPRFRFGGNRANGTGKVRERDKKEQAELRLKEISDRLKRGPVPPPRTRHLIPKNPPVENVKNDPDVQLADDDAERAFPFRSASFSQVDYSPDDKKYVRRRHQGPTESENTPSYNPNAGRSLTLPRNKSAFSSVGKHASTSSQRKSDQDYGSEHLYQSFDQTLDRSNESITLSSQLIACPKTSGSNPHQLPTCPSGQTAIPPSEIEQPHHSIAEETELQIRNPNKDRASTTEQRLSRNSGASTISDDATNAQEKRRDKSRRRKGIYISQWPNSYNSSENILPEFTDSSEFSPFANPATFHLEQRRQSSFDEPQKRPEKTKHEAVKLQINIDKPDEGASASDEPMSPEDNATSLDWPQNLDNAHHLKVNSKIPFLRADSLSEGEPEYFEKKFDQLALGSSDVSDCESRVSTGNDMPSSHIPRRYSKRPLRGPYGQMLEAEMKKPENDRKNQFTSDLKFLEDLSSGVETCSVVSLSSSSSVGPGDPKPKCVTRIRGTSNHSLDETQFKQNLCGSSSPPTKYSYPVPKRKVSVDGVGERGEGEQRVNHQRTTSSPSKLEGFVNAEGSAELLEHLLRGSSEQLVAVEANQQRQNDTRTHVVVELYETERSYVESLQTIVTKYLEPLKNSELQTLLDAALVDEIFYQIPTLLDVHQAFLDELKDRLDHWDVKQKVGDVFLDLFAKPGVMDAYSCYVNNWKRAREILKNAQSNKPGFAKFLEANAREHKGKLALDSLLIKPIQKFPKYELLIQRLLKHTDVSHPDHELLLSAQKSIHDELLKLNCTEKEAVELEQLREIESIIEGLIELVSSERQYLRHDFVNMTAAGGTRKERALFLFTDLLLITSIKRRSGTIRRPPTSSTSVTSVASTLEANKFKLLMKISLDDLEIVRAKDESYKQMMIEMENLTDDISILNQVSELAWNLHSPHSGLDEVVREMLGNLNKQLAEQQNSDNQLSCLDLTLNTVDGPETISIIFSKPEKRAAWEETFNEAKHKLAISGERRPCPELVATVPIRKTRAGLQFTCAAPTMSDIGNDVWVCNSDGYVGQVCVLSLQSEPTVISCNGVCNARILCIASIPGPSESPLSMSKQTVNEDAVEDHSTIQFDSESSSDEDGSCAEECDEPTRTSGICKSMESGSTDSDETDNQHSTMWLGTEDGCIHVYNSSDNIRIKKNKIRLQHGSAILCIIYLDNKVYVSLANGELTIYERDCGGSWDTNAPTSVIVGSSTMPVTKMLPNGNKLWCACGNTIKIFNVQLLQVENTFSVNNDASKAINTLVLSGNAVWLSLQNSAIVKCIHSISYEFLCEVNVAPAVTKMLTCCDDIIRQHKAACLRVTSLLACKDLLWIGTSAGVLLTMPLPHITSTSTKLNNVPTVMGIPHGHTGHVRFLTFMEQAQPHENSTHTSHSSKKSDQRVNTKVLVISGGDGYEDFRSSTVSEVAGREDSTNHLLLWNI